MWQEESLESKRVCPFREKTSCAVTFDSYRQMLAHCRQKHPDTLPLGGDHPAELVVTDPLGKVMSWEEIRRIVDHPSFSLGPQELIVWGERVEVA